MAVLNALKTFFVDWIWKTFCVKWVWLTFCVAWVWQTFCVKWVWKTFFVAWIYQAFWKDFIVNKLKFDKWKGWVYLSPAIALLLVFTIWPMINTVRIAFLNGHSNIGELIGTEYTFGIDNFVAVVEDDQFLVALKNTMLLTLITVPLSTAIALLIAVCLNAIKPLQKFLQTVFFLPYVTNSLAIGMVFATMFEVLGTNLSGFNPKITTLGLANTFLGLFGAAPINWINPGSSYGTQLLVMVIYIVWNALPFKILVLLGGLQGINKQYYDAAKIDGASRSRIFFRVTVPLLSPMIVYVVITGFIGGFKEYSSIVGVFGEKMGPAPGYSMQTMVGLIYSALESDSNLTGRASAAALILFCIIFIVTMINLHISKKRTHY